MDFVDDLKLVHKVSGHEIYARLDLWCYFPIFDFFFIYYFWCFNATFSNISAISWRPALVVEEAGENHRPWASNW
jgi:hypothetical protein